MTPVRVNFARAMLLAIVAVPYSAGRDPCQELAALNQKRPLTPSQLLAVYEVAKRPEALPTDAKRLGTRAWRTAPERSTTAASRLGSVSVPGPVSTAVTAVT
jgi:hypothetical protein